MNEDGGTTIVSNAMIAQGSDYVIVSASPDVFDTNSSGNRSLSEFISCMVVSLTRLLLLSQTFWVTQNCCLREVSIKAM